MFTCLLLLALEEAPLRTIRPGPVSFGLKQMLVHIRCCTCSHDDGATCNLESEQEDRRVENRWDKWMLLSRIIERVQGLAQSLIANLMPLSCWNE